MILLRQLEPKSRARWLRIWKREIWSERVCKKKDLTIQPYQNYTKMGIHRMFKKKRTCIHRVETTEYCCVTNFSSKCLFTWERTSQQFTEKWTSSNLITQWRRHVHVLNNRLLMKKARIRRISMTSTPTWTRQASSKNWKNSNMPRIKHSSRTSSSSKWSKRNRKGSIQKSKEGLPWAVESHLDLKKPIRLLFIKN